MKMPKPPVMNGAANPRWNDGKILSSHGYVMVRVGVTHPCADSKGYAYEHNIVWLSAGKRKPEKNEILHHADEDKTNNRLDNLELITRAEHAALHCIPRNRDRYGRFLPNGERNAGSKHL